MELLATRDQRGANRDAATTADVARQVDQARGVAGFRLRDERKRDSVDGHEQERQTEALHHARADGVSEVDLRVPVRHLEQTQRGNHEADIISQRAWIFERRMPTIGIITIITRPPGDNARPLCIAV